MDQTISQFEKQVHACEDLPAAERLFALDETARQRRAVTCMYFKDMRLYIQELEKGNPLLVGGQREVEKLRASLLRDMETFRITEAEFMTDEVEQARREHLKRTFEENLVTCEAKVKTTHGREKEYNEQQVTRLKLILGVMWEVTKTQSKAGFYPALQRRIQAVA